MRADGGERGGVGGGLVDATAGDGEASGGGNDGGTKPSAAADAVEFVAMPKDVLAPIGIT